MDWTGYLDETNRELAALRAAMPDTAGAFSGLARAAMAGTGMGTRAKELVAVGIAIAVRCDPCIGFHVKAAMRAGASREEIVEVVAIAVYMGGGPALMYGAKTLAAWDDLSAAAA